MPKEHPSLALFHPIIRQWFTEELGPPTDAQRQAWPAIASGQHVLLTAPTGSGKTLAAFLWPIHQLLSGAWEPGRVRVVYISPLKALNNDIQRNLLTPLAALRQRFGAAGQPWPGVAVRTRSGDTPGSERQRMLRHPPEILVTTPESLNILITSPNGRRMLQGVAMVILDEIHAVLPSKRGTHLITAVERLVLESGEFQRVALSATVRPLQTVAEYVGGAIAERPRPVTILRADDPKRYALQVRFPDPERARPAHHEKGSPFWRRLADELKPGIRQHRSTLVFANSRRIVEKLTRFLNEGEEEELAWSHHGSLSKEIRLVVEQRLKAGELKAIVATSSLELGIDVGQLDQVILVASPHDVSSALQRLGRAGHQVGATSHGALYPMFGRDLADAAVMARAVARGDIEPIRPIRAPLDVLAQVLLAMVGGETWELDRLYAFLRCCAPYRQLSRRQFDLVVDMLTGRYADTRLRDLKPRAAVDGVDGTITGRRGALRLVYTCGGTIPDRGYYDLRLAETKAKIGELDEEFVWERSLGDSFALGVQTWRVQRITHNDVEVLPLGPDSPPSIIPFWRAEARNRGWHFSERVARFLEDADGRLEDASFQRELERESAMEPAAAQELIRFLKRQRKHTDSPLPHRHHLLVEHFDDPLNRSGSKQVILHSCWGGEVNHPWSLAMAAAWRLEHGTKLEVFHNNDAVLLQLPEAFSADELLSLVRPGRVEELLRTHLAGSGLFGAGFRENAARALLLPRTNIKKRMPLWLNRLRAKKLLEAVSRHEDFPIVLETWRACLQDSFDLPALAQLLEELQRGEIQVSECFTKAASPFADGLIWRQTNKQMYDDDVPEAVGGTPLRKDLLREVVNTPALRPQLDPALVARFEAKLQRTAPGYAPGDALDLREHVKERLFVPAEEWEALQQELGDRLCRLGRGVCALEHRERLQGVFEGEDLGTFLAQWLQFYGPIRLEEIERKLGLPRERLQDALQGLLADQSQVQGPLLAGSDQVHLCDAENLEILLRMKRAAARPAFEALPLQALPLFLATHQGLIRPGDGMEDLQRGLEILLGYPAPARAWEEWLLPARLQPYHPAWLDSLMQQSDLLWIGCGPQRVAFCFPEDLELLQAPREQLQPLLEQGRSFSFDEARRATGLGSAELTRALWERVWAGQLCHQGFASLRKGVETKFEPVELKRQPRRGRTSFNRWATSRPFQGSWQPLPAPVPDEEADALETIERCKDRVRLLLERYGLLFRQLLARELPALRWGALFRALRLMELSGEVLGGWFFRDLPGPQFVSHQALRTLRRPLPEDAVYWVNATDPASCCGLGLPELPLPKRLASSWLVYRGSTLALAAHAQGRDLFFHLPPDHPDLPRCLRLFKALLDRRFRPLSRVEVRTIDERPALDSPYRQALHDFGFRRDFRSLVLHRRY